MEMHLTILKDEGRVVPQISDLIETVVFGDRSLIEPQEMVLANRRGFVAGCARQPGKRDTTARLPNSVEAQAMIVGPLPSDVAVASRATLTLRTERSLESNPFARELI